MKYLNSAIVVGFLLGVSSVSFAQSQSETDRRLEKLESEYKELKKQLAEKDSESKGEDIFSKLKFHGYGDVHFNSPETSSTATRGEDEFDFHRLVLGWAYEFTHSLRFEGEIDFEHAAQEIELEYAYIEYDLNPSLSLRAGALLMPMGPLNEAHEPPNYYSVERSYTETYLIPTTWQEFGIGVAGQVPENNLRYRLYVVNGLNASGFSATEGIRGGRGLEGVATTKAEDFAIVGRLEHSITSDFVVGGSAYYGGADQSISGLGRVTVGMWEADARYRVHDLELKGEIAGVRVSNADNISTLVNETVGKNMQSWYLETAYHVMPLLCPNNKQDLVAFARYENLNTNKDVDAGFVKDGMADRNIWTFGTAFYPIPKLALKADYERWRDDDGNTLGRFNIGIGWMF